MLKKTFLAQLSIYLQEVVVVQMAVWAVLLEEDNSPQGARRTAQSLMVTRTIPLKGRGAPHEAPWCKEK